MTYLLIVAGLISGLVIKIIYKDYKKNKRSLK